MERSCFAMAAATQALAAILVASPAAAFTPIAANTDQGIVIGSATTTGDVFLGIPFAKPPTGALRFHDPEPPLARDAPLLAVTPAPACLQPQGGLGSISNVSESCLTLDIYRPKHRTGLLPVMVWMYGGGFTTGGSSSYDGSSLSNAGNVIVIPINYRLGALGFLASSALAAAHNGHTGNFGLADQTLAFSWVKQNIRNFGGDPSNITIFGESAGGISVCAQMVSPAAAGLFVAAISESGFCGSNLPSLAAAEPFSDSIVASLGCNTASDVAPCLRALPADTIISASPTGSLGGGFSPVIDGKIIPRSFNDAVTSNRFNHVPAIIGNNHDEGTLFAAAQTLFVGQPVTVPGYTALLQSLYGAAAPRVATIYPLANYSSPTQAYAAVLGDSELICPISTSELELAKRVPTFAYEYNEPDPPNEFGLPAFPGFTYGDAHGLDTGYLFPLAIPAAVRTPTFLALSQIFLLDWAAFATYHTPNTLQSHTRPWYPFLTARDDVYSLQDVPHMEFDLRKVHHCAFWDAVKAKSGT